MSEPTKAVFLSYASQDAEAAKRIADALRAAGVEVWFDQNELVGGDQWDAKIRGQISSCALFVPIISANTQARLEGYFRREWKQAAARTHDMADEKTFLLPVVIDGMRDAEAKVPAEFKTVQWTKLPGGETPPVFAARVKKLLDGTVAGVADPGRIVGASLDDARGRGRATPLQKRFRPWLVAVIVIAVVAAAIWQQQRNREKDPAIEPKAAPIPAAAPLTEARQLVAKAWVLLNKPEMARAELDAADALCKRAAALDPTDAEVWAAWAHVNGWYCFHNLDNSAQRREATREFAARAMQLDAKSYEARLAQAFYWVRGQQPRTNLMNAQSLLRSLLRERPDEPRTLFTLGFSLAYTPATVVEGIELLERLAKTPGFAAVAWDEIGWNLYFTGDSVGAETAADQSLAAQPYWNNLGLKITLAERIHGDMDLAEAALKQMPAAALQEDSGIGFACEVYQWRREPLRTIKVLESLSRDWIRYFFSNHPRAFLLGEARLMAKQESAARRDFQRALDLIEKQLADDPNNVGLLGLKARALQHLGEQEEALKIYRLVKELGSRDRLQVFFEPPEAAIAYIRAMNDGPSRNRWRSLYSAASLRLDPHFDHLRGEPGFQALLAELDARKKPAAAAKPHPQDPEPAGPPPVEAKSVAVLAFANLSDDKGNEYFSDGISEELLNVLAKIPGLKVSARTSAFYFKGKEVPVPEIAKQLGVAYVVEGSVRKAGDKVRITAQLIKAADGFHVWSDTFTRDLKDIFAVQDEIAGLIAKNLQLKMGMVAARPTVDLEAYQEYLAGRALLASGTTTSAREGIARFREAVRLDPKFTAAWLQIARTYVHLSRWGGLLTEGGWNEAALAMNRAVTLEPNSPDVWLALGWMRRTADWNWRGAEQALREALRQRPDHAETLVALGVLLANLGRLQEAITLAQRAVELDPLNGATQMDLLSIFFSCGRFEEAAQAGRRALQLVPGAQHYHGWLSLSLTELGRFAEAEAEAKLEPEPINRLLAQAMTLVRQNRLAEARERLKEIEAKAEILKGAENIYITIVYLSSRMGDMDKTFDALEKARAFRDPSIAWLRTDFFSGSRADPRYAHFLHKFGLADDQLK